MTTADEERIANLEAAQALRKIADRIEAGEIVNLNATITSEMKPPYKGAPFEAWRKYVSLALDFIQVVPDELVEAP